MLFSFIPKFFSVIARYAVGIIEKDFSLSISRKSTFIDGSIPLLSMVLYGISLKDFLILSGIFMISSCEFCLFVFNNVF